LVEDDVVTEEERKELRALLKNTGEEGFITAVITKGGMTIRKCLTAFNVRPVCTPFSTPVLLLLLRRNVHVPICDGGVCFVPPPLLAQARRAFEREAL
jgi:hypothetical protein